jgi:fatty acid desaturase
MGIVLRKISIIVLLVAIAVFTLFLNGWMFIPLLPAGVIFLFALFTERSRRHGRKATGGQPHDQDKAA